MTLVRENPPPKFDGFAQEVYGWAYRVLGQHHDALEVVQEVFLKWTRQCAVRPPDHPRGWLRRVTLNDVLDRRRRPERTRPLMPVPDGNQSAEIEAPDGRGLVTPTDLRDLRSDLAAALDRLTDSQRAVLIAKVFDGMTFAAIAEELDVSTSTAKTHYLRAVRTLRDRLEHRWGDTHELQGI